VIPCVYFCLAVGLLAGLQTKLQADLDNIFGGLVRLGLDVDIFWW